MSAGGGCVRCWGLSLHSLLGAMRVPPVVHELSVFVEGHSADVKMESGDKGGGFRVGSTGSLGTPLTCLQDRSSDRRPEHCPCPAQHRCRCGKEEKKVNFNDIELWLTNLPDRIASRRCNLLRSVDPLPQRRLRGCLSPPLLRRLGCRLGLRLGLAELAAVGRVEDATGTSGRSGNGLSFAYRLELPGILLPLRQGALLPCLDGNFIVDIVQGVGAFQES